MLPKLFVAQALGLGSYYEWVHGLLIYSSRLEIPEAPTQKPGNDGRLREREAGK